MPSCPTCGINNRAGAKFCASCGTLLDAATRQLRPGQVMRHGDYRVERPLSKGGMGAIYLVKNEQAFGRLCVIKEMLDYFDPSNPQEVANAQKRFEDEARTLAHLRHTGIPSIQAYFSEGGHNYIVMEYVEGLSLDEFVGSTASAGRRLTPEQGVQYGIQLCEILEYLATLQPPVVHHDIKPANIIIDKTDGRARLVDFGTAKARLTPQAGGGVGLQKSSIYGTAGYAPPEQYNGRSEPRSDVYALAATLYHLLTNDDPGDHPFAFPTLATLPLNLGPILERALESEARRRVSASELKQALTATLTARPAPRKSAPKAARLKAQESYALLVPQAILQATRPALIQLLQAARGLSATDAEITTWQLPIPVATGLDATRATGLEGKLTALGIHATRVLTSQLLGWRVGLTASDPTLLSVGERMVMLTRIPGDKVCQCYRCGHEWKTTARELPSKCPRCASIVWSQHRLFQCAICAHQLAHNDLQQPAATLFPRCPACQSRPWHPKELPRLTHPLMKQDVGEILVGRSASFEVILPTRGGSGAPLRGRASATVPWLKIQPVTFTGDRVQVVVDPAGLRIQQRHTGHIDILCNAGHLGIEVTVQVNEPPRLVVTPTQLDFGTLKAGENRSLKLVVSNGGGTAGGQDLQGTLHESSGWLHRSDYHFRGDRSEITLTVQGHELPQTGVNHFSLLLRSNGGMLRVDGVVTAPAPQLALSMSRLDFGVVKAREAPQQTLVLQNLGGQMLQGKVGGVPKWLRVSQPTYQGNRIELMLTVEGESLPLAGPNQAHLSLESNGGRAQVEVVAIAPLPHLLVSPARVDFGTLSPEAERTFLLVVSNEGGQLLKGSLSGVPPWLQVQGDAAFQGSESTFRLVVRGQALPMAGSNQATLLFTSNGGRVAVEVVALIPPTTLVTTPARLEFGHRRHDRRVALPLVLTNPGFGTLEGRVTVSEPWLTVEPESFRGNRIALSVTLDTGQLVRGSVYSTVVTIESNGGAAVIPTAVHVSPHGLVLHALRYHRGVQGVLLALLLAAAISPRLLPASPSVSQVAWSPGRAEPLFASQHGIYEVSERPGSGALALVQGEIRPTDLELSEDGRTVAWITPQGNLEMKELGEEQVRKVPFNPPLLAIQFQAQENRLAWLDAGGAFGWQNPTVQRTGSHPAPVRYHSFSPDGGWLGVADATVISLYSVDEGRPYLQLEHLPLLSALTVAPGGERLAWGTRVGSVFQVERATGAVEEMRPVPAMAVTLLTYDPTGTYLAWARADGSVLVWNVAEHHLAASRTARGQVLSLAFNSTGEQLAVGSSEGLQLWQLQRAADDGTP